MVNCSDLVSSQVVSSQGFRAYLDLVRDHTSFNGTLIRECKFAICGALWGYGSTDLAGIGVSPLPNIDPGHQRATNSNFAPGNSSLLPHHSP